MIAEIENTKGIEIDKIYEEMKSKGYKEYDKNIDYQVVTEIREQLGRVEVEKEKIGQQIREYLPTMGLIERGKIIEALEEKIEEVKEKPRGVQENIYTQMYIKIKENDEIIKTGGVLIYQGELGRNERYTLEVISATGVLCVVDKTKQGLIEYYKERRETDIEEKVVVKGVKTEQSISEIVRELHESKLTERKEKTTGKIEVYRVEIVGVGETEVYRGELSEMYRELELNPRRYMLIEKGIPNPSAKENDSLNSESIERGTIIEDIMGRYPIVSDESYIKSVKQGLNQEVEEKDLKGTRLNNYIRVVAVWLERVLTALYESEMVEVPIILIWGELSRREEIFIKSLNNLPLDIVHFAPEQGDKVELEMFEEVKVGAEKRLEGEYPKKAVFRREKTQTYKAKEEIASTLYDGSIGVFQPMQYDKIKSRVLKATIEDIKVMWDVENRFRTPFRAEYGIVEVSNIFTQLNGVPNGDSIDEYRAKVCGLITDDTLIYEGIEIDRGIKGKVREAVFRDRVDYDVIEKSKEYRYSRYSQRTQETIKEKVGEMLELGWLHDNIQNKEYRVLEVVYSMPVEILEKQHTYSYTEKAPKMIYLDGYKGKEELGLEDCILLMFLVLCGWDVLVITPGGYRYMQRYIKDEYLDTTELGRYEIDFEWGTMESSTEAVGVISFIKNIFKK